MTSTAPTEGTPGTLAPKIRSRLTRSLRPEIDLAQIRFQLQ